jgi:hypothetical protein
MSAADRLSALRAAIQTAEDRAEAWEAKGGPIRLRKAAAEREHARLWRIELAAAEGTEAS